MEYVNPNFLVGPQWLDNNLDNPQLRIFDCTTYLLPDPKTTYKIASGEANYHQGHIPGSAFLDLQTVLSDQQSHLRFTLPEQQSFEQAAGRLGISNADHLVFYSCTHPMWATRLWWMFRTYGHQQVSVLNGGLSAWQSSGYPLSTTSHTYAHSRYQASFNPDRIAAKQQVLAAIDNSEICILNALGRSQHTGETSGYGRRGRIAGSDNLPAVDIIDKDTGFFLTADLLKKKFSETGAWQAEKIITYCGGGIAASATLFALALLGKEDQVALYDGSMSEWANDPALPMETG
ncbi:MAG: sulfurtransferase [Gammaproteobacteria bacterium]|nr:sulfurtransferase [Gammaproteobacteria bacterium]